MKGLEKSTLGDTGKQITQVSDQTGNRLDRGQIRQVWDYTGFTVIIFSHHFHFQTFLLGTDAKQALDSVLHDRNGQCVVVMTMQVEDGVPRREILVYSNNEQITQEVLNVLNILFFCAQKYTTYYLFINKYNIHTTVICP